MAAIGLQLTVSTIKRTSRKYDTIKRTSRKCDTGATCNVLSHLDLPIITQGGNPLMETSKAKLKLFDGSFMKPLGLVSLKVVHGGQTEVLKFQVVKGPNKPLLCGATCEKLGFLKLGSQAEVLSLDVRNVPLTAQRVL